MKDSLQVSLFLPLKRSMRGRSLYSRRASVESIVESRDLVHDSIGLAMSETTCRFLERPGMLIARSVRERVRAYASCCVDARRVYARVPSWST